MHIIIFSVPGNQTLYLFPLIPEIIYTYDFGISRALIGRAIGVVNLYENYCLSCFRFHWSMVDQRVMNGI